MWEAIQQLCPLAQPTHMSMNFEKVAINSFIHYWYGGKFHSIRMWFGDAAPIIRIWSGRRKCYGGKLYLQPVYKVYSKK